MLRLHGFAKKKVSYECIYKILSYLLYIISLFLWLYHVNVLFQDLVILIRVKMEDNAKIWMVSARVLAYVGVLETTVKYVVVCLDEILQ